MQYGLDNIYDIKTFDELLKKRKFQELMEQLK